MNNHRSRVACSAVLLTAAALVAARPAGSADVGGGFGERFGSLMSARQAGSGGIALEDPWRRGDLVDVSTILLEPGLRWIGFGYQFGSQSLFRVMTEGFYFGAPRPARMTELADGSFGGQAGSVAFNEYGGRILGQGIVLRRGGWTVAGLARVSLMVQQVDAGRSSGQAVEVGGQGSRSIGKGTVLTLWSLTGPMGRGASRSFAYHVVGGGGLLRQTPHGLWESAEGWALGTELEWLGEGLLHGGLGAVYWFGNMSESGTTVLLRAGLRSASGSAEMLQPRAGLGCLWRAANGWAVQFDYAVSPIGELGVFHYATVGVRLPERKPEAVIEFLTSGVSGRRFARATSGPTPEAGIFFYPEFGEKGRYRFEASPAESASMTAYLADGEGRFLIPLAPPVSVGPDLWEVEWNGLLQYDRPATIDVPYMMIIGVTGRTIYVTVTAKRR